MSEKTKIVITTVGTSVFTNYMKGEIKDILGDDYQDISTDYEKLEMGTMNSIDVIKNVISTKWLKDIRKENEVWKRKSGCLNYDASAEIKSLVEIKKMFGKEIYVYFLCTDSEVSNTAAEIIQSFFTENKTSNINIIKISKIENLQIDNFQNFQKSGLNNLIKSILDIITEEKNGKVRFITNSDFFLNVTGGYKAFIPFLTILGQLYNIHLYYIYEDSKELIKISKLPINFDLSSAFQIYPLLTLIDSSNKNNTGFDRNGLPENIFNKLEQLSIIEKDSDNKYWLTMIGNLFFEYIGRRDWESHNVLGFFMEHLLFEYYTNNINDLNNIKSFDNIKRGFKIRDNNNNTSDIDIKLTNNNGDYIWVECKSYTQVFLSAYGKKNGKDLFEQIKDTQMKIIEENEKNNINCNDEMYIKKYPSKYFLIIYKEKYHNIEDKIILSYLININEYFSKKNIEFKVFYFEIEIPLIPKLNEMNPYSKILNKSLETTEIKELNLNKEN